MKPTGVVYDVIVVGAGIIGSSAAAYLSKGGKRVLLLEQHHFLHRLGSSHGESRITRRTYPSKVYTALMQHAYPMWDAAEAESLVRVFEKKGGLDVLPKGSETLKALLAACKESKVPVEVLSAAQLKERFGLTYSDDFVGVQQTDSGVLRATTAVSMFQQLAAKHGAAMQDCCKVTKCERIPGAAGDKDSVTRVTTAAGDVFHARRVVLCCGAWAGPMLKSLLGVEVPLTVWQCTVMYFKAAQGRDAKETAAHEAQLKAMPVLIDYGDLPLWTSTVDDPSGTASKAKAPCIYSCAAGDYPGLIKFGVHHGPDVTADTRTFSPDVALTVDPVRSWLREHAPFVDPTPVLTDSCLYTMTPDEDFIVDFAPGRPDVIIAAGFSGHGFKFGPIMGRILADLAGKGSTEFDISPFSISRPALRQPVKSRL